MEILEKRTVGSFVAEDYRTAAVFNRFGIDFCCKGHRSIEEVCDRKKVVSEELLNELNKVLNNKQEGSVDYNTWPLDLLADYIEKKHHRYVEEKIPVLLQFLNKLAHVHGGRHPELLEINVLFQECAANLTQHLKKEELILFPFVRKMVEAAAENKEFENPHFGTVENPVSMMMHEHEAEGERFRQIAALSDNYNPPADACTTYRVTYAMLKEFEEDLHKHIHLENNILFPNAIDMEKKKN